MKDSRPSGVPLVIRRRIYECGACGKRWATHEVYRDSGVAAANPQDSVLQFVKQVNQLARDIFGDDEGHFMTARTSTDRWSK